MRHYHLAGQEFQIPCPILELQPFEIESNPTDNWLPSPSIPSSLKLSAQTVGFVGCAQHKVETWSASSGILLKVSGGSDFYIGCEGQFIQRVVDDGKTTSPWPKLDRDILVGPALVLALALRGIWSLHASAVQLAGRAVLFLGESGRGKSTLAAYLSSYLPRLADDILPVTLASTEVTAWPHFPQLKLPVDAHPGTSLPESIPVGWICLLGAADPASCPGLKRLSPSQAAQTLLSRTAGARLFEADMLASHLAFCTRAAQQVPVFKINYPHRKEVLPLVKDLVLSLT